MKPSKEGGAARLTTALEGLTLDLVPGKGSSRLGEVGVRYLKGCALKGTLRTVAPINYFPPSDAEISLEAKKQGLPAVAPGFVRDLCNLSEGGTTAAKPMIHEWFSRRAGIGEKEIDTLVEHHFAIATAIQKLSLATTPGDSTLERVISFLALCAATPGFKCTESAIALPIFVRTLPKVANSAHSAMETAIQLDSDERSLLLADRMDSSGRASSRVSEVTQVRQAAEQLLTSELKRRIAKIALVLKGAPEMKIAGETRRAVSNSGTHRKVVSGGTNFRLRRLKDPSDLPMLTQSSWALYLAAPGLFWQKAANHDLQVKERVTFKDVKDTKESKSKQLLYALIDVSGSMDTVDKIGVALGVLLNRLQGVMKGEAELYYRFFDDKVLKEHCVRTRSDALQAMRRLLQKNFSGQGTDIQGALDVGLAGIEQRKKEGLVRPDLIIVTDGEDSVSQRDLGGTRLHTLFCEGTNRVLSDMSKRSGGMVLSLR